MQVRDVKPGQVFSQVNRLSLNREQSRTYFFKLSACGRLNAVNTTSWIPVWINEDEECVLEGNATVEPIAHWSTAQV